ncbi:BZ3500_MvSof-1268-A1-R1_Chr9g10741 [Microbotryum saponariae]|uniref:BZ3500_MvSof-1268-A1-R1_Chr9g10741 protein n=1 Tax=Microbotryum saponariae TaxID=289078 RepID=A0A2X0KBH8_9BASI|nr:BZ3501_MvSof-1269-A2-R1_Chr9g10489 [Microbotryum saponariae]SDA00613.1 BZ3500_MvSof-1268-A1-R1_Chr9g10741 [Microbotryum saponariae]
MTKEEDKDRDDEDEDGKEDEDNGDGEPRRSRKRGRDGSTRVSRSQFFAYYLHERDDYFSIPHCTQRLFLEFVIDGYPQVEIDRLKYIRLHQENLRLTMAQAQGITDAVANGLTPDQIGCSVILGSTFKNSPARDHAALPICNGAARGLNDISCNRLDLIAQAFDAKLSRLCDNVLGNKHRAGCFGVVLTHTHVIGYYKRGHPHARILFILAPDDYPLSTEAIDKMISAEIPNPSRHPELHEAVTKHFDGDYVEYRSADEVVEVSESLCNGTRGTRLILIVSHAGSRVIQAVILIGDRAGTMLCIPRVRLEASATSSRQLGFTMRRLQFPLRVALAKTINITQGQSLERDGVTLSLHPVFTHGQLYVTLYRAMGVDRIKVLLPSRDPADDDDNLQAGDEE